jgi:hypothetical protein
VVLLDTDWPVQLNSLLRSSSVTFQSTFGIKLDFIARLEIDHSIPAKAVMRLCRCQTDCLEIAAAASLSASDFHGTAIQNSANHSFFVFWGLPTIKLKASIPIDGEIPEGCRPWMEKARISQQKAFCAVGWSEGSHAGRLKPLQRCLVKPAAPLF